MDSLTLLNTISKTEDKKQTIVIESFGRGTGMTKETAISAFLGPLPVP